MLRRRDDSGLMLRGCLRIRAACAACSFGSPPCRLIVFPVLDKQEFLSLFQASMSDNNSISDVIAKLRRGDGDSSAEIRLGAISRQSELDLLTAALHDSSRVRDLKFVLDGEPVDSDGEPVEGDGEAVDGEGEVTELNWSSLFQEIADRESLEIVSHSGKATFLRDLVAAVERNTLGASFSSVIHLILFRCQVDHAREDAKAVKQLAEAMQRNSRRLRITLRDCTAGFLRALVQTKVDVILALDYNDPDEETARALADYLASPNIRRVRSLALHNVCFGTIAGDILWNAVRRTGSDKLQALSLDDCNNPYSGTDAEEAALSDEEEEGDDNYDVFKSDEEEEGDDNYDLAKSDLMDIERDERPMWKYCHLIRTQFISELLLTSANDYGYRELGEAVHEALEKDRLQCLNFCLVNVEDESCFELPADNFDALLNVASRSSSLKRLVLSHVVEGEHMEALLERIPSLPITELDLDFHCEDDEEMDGENEEKLLKTISKNFTIQSVYCAINTSYDYFSEENETILERTLDRNRKLHQWLENPKSVPRQLWPYIVSLAQRAGRDIFFRSLKVLAGEGVALHAPSEMSGKREGSHGGGSSKRSRS